MNCELINNGIDSGLTHQTSDLSKVTYLATLIGYSNGKATYNLLVV